MKPKSLAVAAILLAPLGLQTLEGRNCPAPAPTFALTIALPQLGSCASTGSSFLPTPNAPPGAMSWQLGCAGLCNPPDSCSAKASTDPNTHETIMVCKCSDNAPNPVCCTTALRDIDTNPEVEDWRPRKFGVCSATNPTCPPQGKCKLHWSPVENPTHAWAECEPAS